MARSTIRDVAAHAGVSVATVSRVLGGNYPVAARTRTKVLRAIEELDFVANAHARALSGSSSKLVAIVTSSMNAPFYADIASGVESYVSVEGRLCMYVSTDGDVGRELDVLGLMREQRAEAVILVGGVAMTPEYHDRMARFAHGLASVGGRLVLCGRPSIGPDVPAVVVEYENEGGAHAGTSHLIARGHRRIILLGGIPGQTTGDGRIAGYRRAMADHGIPVDESLMMPGQFGRRFAYDRVRERLARGPADFTAIFALDDILAGAAMHAVRDAGLRVPEDVSVLGYNDSEIALDLYPALTSVHIPVQELGRTAARLAISQRPGDERARVMLGTHVVVRDSVVGPPGR
ncbi:LacI family DNA-binding transcriptional regulator [Phytomonospora endophytica]|uniref:LacI family transcriptional regulator n=1 Tax=Phytomonospora endophytica TaxID=714109 RepID=A0A841FQH1_9ACTN|nr:LacI family DNA-binding transcriptional regulator [Phytomonospora endophytica]MBB6036048.1 LacI family transcriptional regulator [Phytomonospora endophytica]GIG66953.1 LacI family transcriptional regulator [Phytomonospora endophytica]